MAIIGAGKYVFGEDIPLGKYCIKAVSGEGKVISVNKTGEESEAFFKADDDLQSAFYGYSPSEGSVLVVGRGLMIEITPAKPIEI